MAGLLGGLSGILGGLSGQNNYDVYNKTLNNIAKGFDPFVNAGDQALNPQLNAFLQGLNNPQGLYNQYAQSFKESPYQNALLGSITNMMNANSANTGMLGSTSANNDLADHLKAQSTQDFNNYMNTLLGIRNNSLAGLGGLSTNALQALTGRSSIQQEGALGALQGANASTGLVNKLLGGIGSLF